MTFKHGKFEDSSTMRSFIKVAEQKGWVKSEPLQKKASADSLDLTPTASLTENVLKLCAGLRQSGMDKYADEVEKNFFNYKRANDLYNVTKEKGDDLVDAAHPDGSHKMEGVEGDAVIETILDKHLMHIKMVDKKPTGKLATASDILKAVRIVLAEDLASIQSKLDALMAGIRAAANRVTSASEADLTVSWSTFAEGISKLTQPATIANMKQIQNIISQQVTRLKPGGVFFSGVSEEAWKHVSPNLNLISSNAGKAIELINQREDIKEKGEAVGGGDEEKKEAPSEEGGKPRMGVDPYPEATKLSQQLERYLGTLRGYRASVNSDPDLKDADAKAPALSWIDTKTQQINAIKSQLASVVGTDESNNIAPSLLLTLQKITSEFPQFQKEWIG